MLVVYSYIYPPHPHLNSLLFQTSPPSTTSTSLSPNLPLGLCIFDFPTSTRPGCLSRNRNHITSLRSTLSSSKRNTRARTLLPFCNRQETNCQNVTSTPYFLLLDVCASPHSLLIGASSSKYGRSSRSFRYIISWHPSGVDIERSVHPILIAE